APLSPPFPYTTLFRSQPCSGSLYLALLTSMSPAGAWLAKFFVAVTKNPPSVFSIVPFESNQSPAPVLTSTNCCSVIFLRSASPRSEEHTSELQSRENL